MKKQGYSNSVRSTERTSKSSEDTVRDNIGQLWLGWCEQQKKDGGRGVVCPLDCTSANFGATKGLHQCNLDW